jgi:hypothetical protein
VGKIALTVKKGYKRPKKMTGNFGNEKSFPSFASLISDYDKRKNT